MSQMQNASRKAHSAKIPPTVLAAAEKMASMDNIEGLGSVFTRLEVVEFILDLVGYTIDRNLFEKRILEPSFGGGDFLLPIIRRLIQSWRTMNQSPEDSIEMLKNAIQGVEIHHRTFESTYQTALGLLRDEGFSKQIATKLLQHWLYRGDFLLKSDDSEYDFVVGNPPYVRQELIPEALINEYRSRYATIYDRADLYIPFIEKSLLSLKHGGSLGFICADRWMKNRYGGPLRQLIAESSNLKFYIDMTDTMAFHSIVAAYPAITILTKDEKNLTRIAHRPSIDKISLENLAKELRGDIPNSGAVRELAGVLNHSEPWLLESPDQMRIIRRIEERFPTLEEANCRVGIGVATGADKVFIGEHESLDVERECKLPLAMTKDIASGKVVWTGQGVINPFNDEGGLRDLSKYPRLRRYLHQRQEDIQKRHCAKKNPSQWYRTIDRITPSLAKTPKLLIPDIKGKAHVVYEEGVLYPHHNLYYVVSNDWDLRALQAVLMSEIARLFVATYSTKMRGGYLRFQAQYLRRIRLPFWSDVSPALRTDLKVAAMNSDLSACNRAVFSLYGLSKDEEAALGGGED